MGKTRATSNVVRVTMSVALTLIVTLWLLLDPSAIIATKFLTPPPRETQPPPGFISSGGGIVYSDDRNFEIDLPSGYLPNGAIITAYPLGTAPTVKRYKAIGFPYCIGVWVNGKVVAHLLEPITLSRRNYPSTSLTEAEQQTLHLAFYDQSKSAWVELLGRVDLATKTVSAQTDSLLLSSVCDPEKPQVLVAVVVQTEAIVTPTKTAKPTATSTSRNTSTPTNTAIPTKTAPPRATKTPTPTISPRPTNSPIPSSTPTASLTPIKAEIASATSITPTPTSPIQPPSTSFGFQSILLYGGLLLFLLLVGGGVYAFIRRKGA